MSPIRFRARRALVTSRRFLHRYGGRVAVIAWLCGFVAFVLNGLPILEAIYQAIAAFVFASEVPEHGGWYGAVEVYRIFAPVLAGGALIDFAARLLPEPSRVPKRVDDHVVVVGVGRLGYAIAKRLSRDGVPTAVINLSADSDLMRALHERHAVYAVTGDARDAKVLLRAGIDRAHTIITVTGEDDVNVGVALLAWALPDCHARIWAHVRDPGLRALVTRTSEVRAFSVQVSAARKVAARLRTSYEADAERLIFVVAGHGRFGQAVVAELEPWLPVPRRLIVLDRDPTNGESCSEGTRFIAGDLVRPDGLESLTSEIQSIARPGDRVVCLLCTDNDVANLAFALELREVLPVTEIDVHVRMFTWPPEFTETTKLEGIRAIDVWQEVGDEIVHRAVWKEG